MTPSRLQNEIRQSKPMPLEVEVHLNLKRTEALLSWASEALFREHGLTDVTYNILRILRGAGADGLPCGEIGKRMLTRVPDVTRLVDRLVKMDLVERYRTDEDRRLVFQVLTPKGKQLLAKLDDKVESIPREQVAHMTKTELKTLNSLLVKARERVNP
ncbi:MAG: MarR family transcriptional regulator [Candidatus Hydrogenedentota bacterium]